MPKRIYVRSHYRRSAPQPNMLGSLFGACMLLYHATVNHPKTAWVTAASVVTLMLYSSSGFVGTLALGATVYLAWRLYRNKPSVASAQPVRHTELLGIRTIGDFYAMSPQQFEHFVCKLFQLQGYSAHVIGQAGDQGIDVEIRTFGEDGRPLRYVAQCKRYSGTVGQPIVRDFYGSFVGQAEAGYLITTGSFTQPARDFAQGRPIHLVDGPGLVSWTNSVAQRLHAQ